MKNETFAEIVATTDAKISGVEYPRVLQNKNRLLRANEHIIGVKTGFTSKAGRCFVGALDDNEMRVVCVVLNCGPMFPESEDLMQRATTEFFMHRVLAKDTIIDPTFPSDRNTVGMVEDDFYYPLRDGELDEIEIAVNQFDIVVLFRNQLIHTAQNILATSNF